MLWEAMGHVHTRTQLGTSPVPRALSAPHRRPWALSAYGLWVWGMGREGGALQAL